MMLYCMCCENIFEFEKKKKKWRLLTPYGPKMRIFNFELVSKLDLHFDVKFDGEFDGDG